MVPVVDGDFIPDEPRKLLHNAAQVDYLVGINDMDGHSFSSQDIPALANKDSLIHV